MTTSGTLTEMFDVTVRFPNESGHRRLSDLAGWLLSRSRTFSFQYFAGTVQFTTNNISDLERVSLWWLIKKCLHIARWRHRSHLKNWSLWLSYLMECIDPGWSRPKLMACRCKTYKANRCWPWGKIDRLMNSNLKNIICGYWFADRFAGQQEIMVRIDPRYNDYKICTAHFGHSWPMKWGIQLGRWSSPFDLFKIKAYLFTNRSKVVLDHANSEKRETCRKV